MRYLPLFPLPIVVYPGEIINLHIFEHRYKQLIEDCIDKKSTFGIPTFIKDHLPGNGTEVEIVELVKEYENGEMDITVKGQNIFRIINFYKNARDKLYSASDIEDININFNTDTKLKKNVLKKMQELFIFAGIDKKLIINPSQHVSYLIAHTIGFSLEQEYELLGIEEEGKRLTYIYEHLTNILPVVEEFENLKQKIKMNGHFKNFPKLDI